MGGSADGNNGNEFMHDRGKIGGSKIKREKGTVLQHRSSSQRRAMPAALYGAFQKKESCFRTIQEKTDRCRFWGLGAW